MISSDSEIASLREHQSLHKNKFSSKDVLNECHQIHWKLWIWSYLLKKSLIENFIIVHCMLNVRNKHAILIHRVYSVLKPKRHPTICIAVVMVLLLITLDTFISFSVFIVDFYHKFDNFVCWEINSNNQKISSQCKRRIFLNCKALTTNAPTI